MTDDQDLEQYSAETAERLNRAAEGLVDALRRYVRDARGMHGGSSEVPRLIHLSDEVDAAARAFQASAFEHTGMSPLGLEEPFDDEVCEECGGCLDCVEDDGEEEPEEPASRISVVSRWDLDVVALDVLLAAGREAHRRNRPEETEDDAQVAVSTPEHALQAIAHEAAPDPWLDVPGLRPVTGARVYVAPEEPWQPLEDLQDVVLAVQPPAGELLFSEDWDFG